MRKLLAIFFIVNFRNCNHIINLTFVTVKANLLSFVTLFTNNKTKGAFLVNFYNNFIKLCNEAGKSPSKVALEIGTTKPSVTRWKNGSKPSDATLQKIADYFDVTVDFLINNDINKNNPAADSDEALAFALFGGDTQDITPEMLADVRDYAQFVRERRKKENL